jgi:hypothetical protein
MRQKFNRLNGRQLGADHPAISKQVLLYDICPLPSDNGDESDNHLAD